MSYVIDYVVRLFLRDVLVNTKFRESILDVMVENDYNVVIFDDDDLFIDDFQVWVEVCEVE